MDKRIVEVRGLRFGEGRPKVCIPLTACDAEELREQLAAMKGCRYDFAEWRADFYEGAEDRAVRDAAVKLIREAIGDKPLLFTYRTVKEGGSGNGQAAFYRKLLIEAAVPGSVDMIDLELFTAGDNAAAVIEDLHRLGAAVICSSHEFERTPSAEEMTDRLCRMQMLGADMTKLAVMPENRMDVIRLMEAAVRMEEEYGDRPCITMAMGKRGVLSRIGGILTGTAVTFGACTKASAPGQLPADELFRILEILGENV